MEAAFMTPLRYALRFGVNILKLRGVEILARLSHNSTSNVTYVDAIVNGREAGGFHGTHEECETWFTGWISGYLAHSDHVPRSE